MKVLGGVVSDPGGPGNRNAAQEVMMRCPSGVASS